jgi:hypothetical protein
MPHNPTTSWIDQMFGSKDYSSDLHLIESYLRGLTLKMEKLMIDVSKIHDAAVRTEAGVDSILAAFAVLTAQVKDLSKQLADAIAAADPVAQQAVQTQLDTLATDLNAKADAIATAMVAPAAP